MNPNLHTKNGGDYMCCINPTNDVQRSTLRIQALYAFLNDQGDEWTPMIDVYHGMYGVYPYWTNGDFHNSHARRLISADIQAINECSSFEKIVIKGNHGIKLANEEEVTAYINNLYASVFRKLKRVRTIEKKASLDGQFQILTDNYIDAFIKKGETV